MGCKEVVEYLLCVVINDSLHLFDLSDRRAAQLNEVS